MDPGTKCLNKKGWTNMTKKNYIALGNMLREHRPKLATQATFALWDQIEIALCEVLAKDNPRFDVMEFHDFIHRRTEG